MLPGGRLVTQRFRLVNTAPLAPLFATPVRLVSIAPMWGLAVALHVLPANTVPLAPLLASFVPLVNIAVLTLVYAVSAQQVNTARIQVYPPVLYVLQANLVI